MLGSQHASHAKKPSLGGVRMCLWIHMDTEEVIAGTDKVKVQTKLN